MQSTMLSPNNINNRLISQWQQEDVLNFLKSIGLSQYLNTFQNNQISGYDLCCLSSDDIINELRIIKIHDRNIFGRTVREAILEQLTTNLTYDEKSINIQLDFDRTLTLESLLGLIKDIFRINDNRVYVLTSNQELLSPNCRIVDLIFINPQKYRFLTITNDLRKLLNEPNKISKLSEFNIKPNDPTTFNEYNNDNNFKAIITKTPLFPESPNYEINNNDLNHKESLNSTFKNLQKITRPYKNKEENMKNTNYENSLSSNLKPNSSHYLNRVYDYSTKSPEINQHNDEFFKENQRNNDMEGSEEFVSNSKKGEIIERTNNYFNNLKNYENSSHSQNKKETINALNSPHNEISQEGNTPGISNPESNPTIEEKSRYNNKYAASEKRFYRNLVDNNNSSNSNEEKKEMNSVSMSKYNIPKNDDIYNKGNDLKSKIDSMRNEINNTLKNEFHKNKELDETNFDSSSKNRETTKTNLTRNNTYYSTKLYK